MKYTFDCDRWGSSFSVPSKVVDKYIKLSDGDFVKVLLCILCSTERECDSAKLPEKSGLSENTVIIFFLSAIVVSYRRLPVCISQL